MKPTETLHRAGQSIWLDNITRAMLDDGTLEGYIRELSVTGLTSNPSIFDSAIRNGEEYDAAIRSSDGDRSDEEMTFDLAIADIQRAADLLHPVHVATDRVDGWVSLEVSPHLAYDTDATIAMAKDLFERCERENVFIKIPGTREGLPAIEESIFAGVPVNVTLLFSREQYLAAAYAYLRGIERRVEAGLSPRVASVASVFVSRWDVAVSGKVPAALEHELGIAVATRTYKAYRDLLASERWLRLLNVGARSQRLLWGSTGTKDPKASDVLYVEALAAPHTVNTMPEKTLHALADHGEISATLPSDGGDCEEVLDQLMRAGVDLEALAAKLQSDGAAAFVNSWDSLLGCVAGKRAALKKTG